jgi:hypothetical protein
VMILHLCEDCLSAQGIFEGEGRNAPMYADVVRSVKDLLNPLVQPNRDVEEAVRLMFSGRGLKLPRKRPRHPEVRVGEHDGGDRPRRRRRRPKRKPDDTPGETPDTPGETNKD